MEFSNFTSNLNTPYRDRKSDVLFGVSLYLRKMSLKCPTIELLRSLTSAVRDMAV